MAKKPPTYTRLRLEEQVERQACEKIKDEWPQALIRKMSPQGNNDWPDRMIILPGVPAFFIEFKRVGTHPRPSQTYIMDRIKSLGSHAYVCYAVEEAIEFCRLEISQSYRA